MESFLDCAEHRFVYAPPTTMYCAEVNVETPFKDMLPVPTILLIFPRDVKKTITFLFYNISNFPFCYSTDCTCGVQTKFWSNGALSGLFRAVEHLPTHVQRKYFFKFSIYWNFAILLYLPRALFTSLFHR